MLPLSSRLLARYEASSVPLQRRPRLKPTNIVRDDFTGFLQWTRTQITKNQKKRSQPLPRNPQGSGPRKPKRIEGLQSFIGKPSNAKTRQKRVRKTVLAAIRNDAAPALTASSWPGEDWKAEGWGQDGEPRNFGNAPKTHDGGMRVELKPPPSHQDLSTKVKNSASSELTLETSELVRSSGRTRESDVEYTRRVEGVLTPLGSPVLQGASLLVFIASLHAHGSP
jgi:hypothetical protein